MYPSRTVTFLFTDIEDSTRLWEQHAEAMQQALARHDGLLRRAIESHNGAVFKTIGDSFCAAFATASDALAAAIAAQRALSAKDWGETPIRVRMALHAGVAEERDDDFFGPDVNRVARLLSAGRGGQVLLSASAHELVRNQLPADVGIQPLGSYQLKGLASPERIYQLLAPGLQANHSPLVVVGVRFDNLPQQITPFIGRQTELVQLRGLLADPAVRLVTIVGQGGAGKTRLAVEAVKDIAGDYQNGALFVSLEGLISRQDIIHALASDIGLQFRSGGDQAQQLFAYIREKETILILDNFEQALDNAQVVSNLLHAAPEIKVVVTSREKLSLNEETLFQVAGLDYSGQDAPGEVMATDALQLFIQGAQRIRPGYRPQPDEALAVARVCRLVDGLPLGILLAAAWMALLSPQEIGDEIVRSLDFLSSDLRNIPERHRSIRAVIDSTWRHLDPEERAIFARLSVFHGAFSRPAAQAVTAVSLQQLLHFANKSLILRDQHGRFRVHQLPLQFAREKLATQAEVDRSARQAHADYFAGLLVQLVQDNPAEQVANICIEINKELPNIRAGWRWVAEWGDLGSVADYSAGLGRFYDERGWYLDDAEDVAVFERALRRVGPAPPDANKQQWRLAFCHLHEILADIAALAGQYDDARMHYDAALGREPEDQPACLARLYRKKANTYRIQLEFDRALETYLAAEAALEASQTRGVTWRQEWIQIQLERTWLRYWQGAWDAVTKLDQEIRPQVERFGTLAQQVNFFNALAVMSLRRQRYLHPLEALAYTRTAYEKSLESENPHDIAWSAFTHGFSLLWCDDYGQAEELMRTALTLARENGDFVHQARCLTYLAIAYRKQGQVDLTRHFTTMSLKTAKKTKMLEYAGTAHGNLAWLAWHDGNYDLVEAEGRQAFAEWDQVGSQHASITFKWTAIWPLIALALRRERLAEAIDYAKQLLEPGQQRLPDAPRRAVERAVYAWSEDRPADARSELLAALNGSDLRPLPSGVLIDGERTVAGADAQPARTGAAIALTSREAEVLQLIAAGLSNKEIAERLVVEVSTVKKHINHLFGKLDVDSRTRAIVRAQELNLI